MENLDPASVETQQTVVSEIFRSAGDEKSLTLGLLLKAYDVVIAKHGINATDLVGIQIYRSLLHWGRDRDRPVAATAVRQPLAPLDPEPLWDPRPSQGPVQWMRPMVKAVLPEPVVQLEASLMTFQRQPRPETIKTLRKVMDAWIRQVHETREMLLQERHQMKRWRCQRSMDSWKAVIARRRMLKEQQLEVLSQREQQTKADTFQHWKHRRPQAPEAPAAPTPELDVLLASVAFWKRCCRRAMDAWLLVVQWEALATRLQRNSSFQLLSAVFQVWVEQWHEDRKEAALLQRATVFRRKQGQLLGLQSLRWNVILAHRTRAFLEAQSQLEEGLRMRQRRALEVCWSAMSRYVEQRRLMKLYRNWADVHWLRTRLGAAWQVWFAWHQKRGKVVAMRSSAQILASWHWLRVHAAAHPERSVTPLPRVPLLHAPWWHAAAADLLFSPAPFKIHPHHMKVVQLPVLAVFVPALLKKMMNAWIFEVQEIRQILRPTKLKAKLRYMDLWKGAATRCRRLRKLQLQVSHRRSQQIASQALQHWANRWSNLVQHQQNLREFDVACWRRSCRRAMDAWLLAMRWEALAARLQRSSSLRLLSVVFQVWVAQWHEDRKESVRLRLSELFLRKRGLKGGIKALRLNVLILARKRALAKAKNSIFQAQRRLLEACWSAMSRYVEQRRLMKLYRNWADVHWLRTRLGAAWQVWFAWHQKRGKVVAMRSSAQILASWHWLRVHAAAHPERFVARSSARVPHAPWWHAAAADLLFSPAPFEIHPHHMKALRQDSLVLFTNALLKRMIHAWMQQARDMQEVFRQAKLRTTRRCVDAWKGAATRCQRLRKVQLQVSHQRSQQMTSQALQHWANRWSNLVQHQQNLREFDVACWHRSCRRAMDAWLLAMRWEALAARLQRSSSLRFLSAVFQVWVAQWHEDRKESVLLRLSELFLRKRGLKGGIKALRLNVLILARKRALAKANNSIFQAQHRLLEVCWTAILRYSEERKLMKLYRNWADVHWLRTRLAAAWQVWFAWHQKRGKVVAMRSSAQILASWHWLRVHAAAHPERFVARSSARVPHAPWWHVAAADLLFSQAPFEIHPHHMKVVREEILATFAGELLKKMMQAWIKQARDMQEVFRQAKLRTTRRCVDAWKGAATRCRRLRKLQLQVSHQRSQQMTSQALQHWANRWSNLVQHQQNLREFDVACWHRSCRRAMDAWLLAVRWEAFVTGKRTATSLGLQETIFQAWVVQWRCDRKAAAVQRLSALFPRKRGLRKGIAALRRNVKFHSRESALRKVDESTQQARRRLLEACWAAMLRNLEKCQLMILYLSWADANRIRTRLTNAFHAWLAWRKSRKIVAMSNDSQILASWHWIRRTLDPPRCGFHPRFTHFEDAFARTAAELLFGSIPFEAHPHRKAVREEILATFAGALLKKMMQAWIKQARDMQEVFRQAKLRTTRRCVDAWKGAATRCRRLRKLQLQVSHQRSQQMTSQALQHWAHRWSNLVQHQQNLREFDVACWHRSCRRAMDAWLLARQWEVRVAQQLKSSKLQLQRQIFEAWKTTWKAERKEALLLLQSDRLQRQLRLRRSFRVLLWHAEHRQGQMGWIKRWWILAHLSRRSREVEALQQKAENFANHKNRQLILALLSTWHIFAGARRAACRAGQSVRKRHQQVLLLKWRNSFEAREAARVAKCQQAVNHSLVLRSFAGWAMWYRRNLSIRQFASKVFSRLRRNALTLSIHAWAKVARELAARETRYLLQVNDFQRKHKRQAHLLLIQAWHREAKASADATRTARLRKVFACWRLASQEQRLLQKYLQECATISFQGSQSPKEVSVGPADLERIYREMADYRWNVDAWDLSD